MDKLTFTRFCLATSLASAIAFQITSAKRARCETSEAAHSEVAPGKLEYQEACARCHGEAGKGRGPTPATSTKKPTDLTILAKNNGGVFPEEKILRIIHNTEAITAHGPREAPVWGKRFSLRLNVTTGSSLPGSSVQVDYRVRQLMQYLKSIQER
jgi:mono/diheme cytochrome c family protein